MAALPGSQEIHISFANISEMFKMSWEIAQISCGLSTYRQQILCRKQLFRACDPSLKTQRECLGGCDCLGREAGTTVSRPKC